MGIRTGEFKRLHIADLSRYSEKLGKYSYIRRFLYLFRKCQTSKGLVFFFYRLLFKINQDKHGMEIPIETTIGKGLYLGHAYNITINGSATLGENVNLHKGVTIGQENRGNRKGAPTIGDDVWIGINATIVGNITIGNDVLIAPNTYVNCDVPNHSIVFGNPCVIKHRDNATEDYVNNKV